MIGLPDPNGELRPGMYYTVEVKVPRKTPSLIVSAGAMIFDSDGLHVLVENGIAHSRKITEVRDPRTEVEVSNSVKPRRPGGADAAGRPRRWRRPASSRWDPPPPLPKGADAAKSVGLLLWTSAFGLLSERLELLHGLVACENSKYCRYSTDLLSESENGLLPLYTTFPGSIAVNFLQIAAKQRWRASTSDRNSGQRERGCEREAKVSEPRLAFLNHRGKPFGTNPTFH